MFTRGLAESTE